MRAETVCSLVPGARTPPSLAGASELHIPGPQCPTATAAACGTNLPGASVCDPGFRILRRTHSSTSVCAAAHPGTLSVLYMLHTPCSRVLLLSTVPMPPQHSSEPWLHRQDALPKPLTKLNPTFTPPRALFVSWDLHKGILGPHEGSVPSSRQVLLPFSHPRLLGNMPRVPAHRIQATVSCVSHLDH